MSIFWRIPFADCRLIVLCRDTKVANIILPIINRTSKPNAKYNPDQIDFKEQVYGMAKAECYIVMVLDLAVSQREQ